MLTLKTLINSIFKGRSSLSARSVLSGLDEYYRSINSKICVLACKKNAKDTTIYCQLPSDSTKGVMYDIVIWINSVDSLDLNTEFKVYSNSPSFFYNLAYVFHKNGSLLFPEKYPQGVGIEPTVKNPNQTTFFDRHIYAVIKMISDKSIGTLVDTYGHNPIPSVKSFLQKKKEIDETKIELKKLKGIS